MRGALVILLVASSPAFADNGPHKEGHYGGVTPGDAAPRDPAAQPVKLRRPPARGTLTWIGFEAKAGGAEVFFQSVAPFELTQRVEGNQLIVHLGLSRLGRNTWRQIDTRFFETPLANIVARSVGAARASKARPGQRAGIEARIAFKNAGDARQATLRSATEADGMYYAYLSFPETSADTAGAAGAAATNPATDLDDAPAKPQR